MHIRLMPDVPDNPVFRGIKFAVQSERQFHDAEIRCEVTAGFEDGTDQQRTNLLAEYVALRIAQMFQI